MISKKFKVAIIETIGGSGGMTIYNLGVCYGLANNNCDVSLFTSKETPIHNKEKFFNVFRVFNKIYNKKYNKIYRFFSLLKSFKKIKFFFRKIQPEIIYSHLFTYSVVELALIIFLYLQRKKVVINIHDPQSLGNSSNKIVKYVIQKILKTKNFSITTHTKYAQSIIQGQFSNKDCQIMPHSILIFSIITIQI